MRIMGYLKSLIRANTYDSSKSFALVLSVLVGALIGLCVCFCLVWDVCCNGHLATDLEGLGKRKRNFNGQQSINEKKNENGEN